MKKSWKKISKTLLRGGAWIIALAMLLAVGLREVPTAYAESATATTAPAKDPSPDEVSNATNALWDAIREIDENWQDSQTYQWPLTKVYPIPADRFSFVQEYTKLLEQWGALRSGYDDLRQQLELDPLSRLGEGEVSDEARALWESLDLLREEVNGKFDGLQTQALDPLERLKTAASQSDAKSLEDAKSELVESLNTTSAQVEKDLALVEWQKFVVATLPDLLEADQSLTLWLRAAEDTANPNEMPKEEDTANPDEMPKETDFQKHLTDLNNQLKLMLQKLQLVPAEPVAEQDIQTIRAEALELCQKIRSLEKRLLIQLLPGEEKKEAVVQPVDPPPEPNSALTYLAIIFSAVGLLMAILATIFSLAKPKLSSEVHTLQETVSGVAGQNQSLHNRQEKMETKLDALVQAESSNTEFADFSGTALRELQILRSRADQILNALDKPESPQPKIEEKDPNIEQETPEPPILPRTLVRKIRYDYNGGMNSHFEDDADGKFQLWSDSTISVDISSITGYNNFKSWMDNGILSVYDVQIEGMERVYSGPDYPSGLYKVSKNVRNAKVKQEPYGYTLEHKGCLEFESIG